MKKDLCILLSNDDGIHAPGLQTLKEIAHSISKDVWIVAPAHEQSGASHSLTLHTPLRYRSFDDRTYSVEGTPTDAIVMAMEVILKGKKPDLILSGVNAGYNLAEDINYSGTVSAAKEGVAYGIPSVAFSMGTDSDSPIYWETPQQFAPKILKILLEKKWPIDTLINVNFPNLKPNLIKGIEVVKQGKRPLYKSVIQGVDPRGKPYYWVGGVPEKIGLESGTDLLAIHEHKISITPIHVDSTHLPTLHNLEDAFT